VVGTSPFEALNSSSLSKLVASVLSRAWYSLRLVGGLLSLAVAACDVKENKINPSKLVSARNLFIIMSPDQKCF